MKFFAVFVLVFAVIAVLLIYATTRPDTFTVQRSIGVAAAPEQVFTLIDDPHGWSAWSPFGEGESSVTRRFEGAAAGLGSAYVWESARNAGRIEIVDDAPPVRVVVRLAFRTPFEREDTATFTLTPNGSATTVTWLMVGRLPYVAKVMTMILDSDTMIGRDLEAGLANLKTAAEARR